MNQVSHESLGRFLRTEREKRNISIEQLAYATRIGLRMLRALENDHFNELPAQAFVRGYLQAYGKYLGLDVQDLLLRYQHHLAVTPNAGRVNIKSHYLYVKERYQERRQVVLIISLFIALLACSGTYMVLKIKREKTKHTRVAALSTPVAAPETSSSIPPPPSTTVTVNTPPSQVTPPATPPAVITSTPGRKKNILVLTANDEVWLRYQADDGAIKRITLQSNQTLTISAEKVFKIFSSRLGNLSATLNNQAVPSLIQPGRGKSAVLPESEIPNYPPPLFPPLNPTSETQVLVTTPTPPTPESGASSSN